MTIGHSPKRKETKGGSGLFCLVVSVFSLSSTLLDVRILWNVKTECSCNLDITLLAGPCSIPIFARASEAV